MNGKSDFGTTNVGVFSKGFFFFLSQQRLCYLHQSRLLRHVHRDFYHESWKRGVLQQALMHLQEMDLCSFLNVFMYVFLYFSSYEFYNNIFPQIYVFPKYPLQYLHCLTCCQIWAA